MSTRIDKAWFASRMKEKGLSTRRMAKLMDMHFSALSRTLNGERRMQIGEAQKIAELFDRSLEDVLVHQAISDISRDAESTKSSGKAASKARRDGSGGFREGAATFRGVLEMKNENEDYIVAPRGGDPLFGCMAGTLTLSPDVDYAAPADPDWGKVYED